MTTKIKRTPKTKALDQKQEEFRFPEGPYSATPKMDVRFIVGAASNLSSWEQFMKEVIDNLQDYQTTAVHIQTARGRDAFFMVDAEQPNMTDKHQHCYAFTLGPSTSAGDITKRGCRGQGERLAALDRAGRLTLIALLDETRAARYRIDRDQWLRCMSDRTDYQVDREVITIPTDFPFKTGRRIILEDLRTTADPNEGRQSEPVEIPSDANLADILQKFPRWVVNTTTLNGKRLRKKETPGDRVRYEENHEQFGVIDIELVIPHVRDIRDDIDFGISARAMSFDEFLRELRTANPELYADIPEALKDPRLTGHIFIGALKLFKTQSYSFKEELYTSTFCRTLVHDLLHNTIGSLAAKLLAKVEAQLVQTAAGNILETVISKINAAEGGSVRRPGGGGGLIAASDPVIHPRIKRLESGDTIRFEMMNIEQDDRVVWDDSNAGGAIDADTGNTVEFTAGRRRGEFTLSATVTRAGGREYKPTASIHVISHDTEKNTERLFRTQPSFVSLNRNDKRRVRLVNIGKTSREFIVEVSDPILVTATLDDNGTELLLETHQKIAEGRVRVVDKHDKTIFAVCDVEVAPEPIDRLDTGGEKPGGLGGNGNHDSPLSKTIQIDGRWFRIVAQATTDQKPAVVKGKNDLEIWIDTRKPIFTTADIPGGYEQVLLHHIALAYAAWKVDTNENVLGMIPSGGEVYDIVTKLLIRWQQSGIETASS